MAVKKATTTDDIKETKPEVEEGYTRLESPVGGGVTIVPDSILDALLDAGYKRK